MEIKRGDIVLASRAGDLTQKPRPFLVVQSNAFAALHTSVSMCPITSVLAGEGWIRVAVQSTPVTGLDRDSEVEVDKISTLKRDRIVKLLGSAPSDAMVRVDEAMRRWLDL